MHRLHSPISKDSQSAPTADFLKGLFGFDPSNWIPQCFDQTADSRWSTDRSKVCGSGVANISDFIVFEVPSADQQPPPMFTNRASA